MNSIRITKYNPENRNSEGHYLLDEWTCPSEVGKTFDGVKFKESEYFEIESKYVDAAIKLIESTGLNYLRIVGLNTNFISEYLSDQNDQWLFESKFSEIELFEDKSVDISDIKTIIKMILRNYIGCRLEVDGKFSLHFGYDFYMYASIPGFDKDTIEYIEGLGLYFENIDQDVSGYSYEFSVDVAGKGEECVDNTVYLVNITRDNIRIALDFSNEHPCNHHFQITEDNYAMFVDQVDFDFNVNEYFLNCEKITLKPSYQRKI